MVGRMITLKYAGKCRDCGASLLAGSKAKYHGNNVVSGLDCHRAGLEAVQVYSSTSGQSWEQCNCEDYPCCGH